METFHPGCGKVDQGRAAKGAGETHSRHEAEGTAPPMFGQEKKLFLCLLLPIQPLTSLLSASAEHSAEETPRAFLLI